MQKLCRNCNRELHFHPLINKLLKGTKIGCFRRAKQTIISETKASEAPSAYHGGSPYTVTATVADNACAKIK